jgi:DNA-binding NarL/FixJ family response regulator
MVAFREVIIDYLRNKQERKCADCGQPIEQYYQERVVYRTDIDDTIDNLKLVHFDCKKAHRVVDTRRRQAGELLADGMSVRHVATVMNISERTVQRYVRRRRKRLSK